MNRRFFGSATKVVCNKVTEGAVRPSDLSSETGASCDVRAELNTTNPARHGPGGGEMSQTLVGDGREVPLIKVNDAALERRGRRLRPVSHP